MILPFSGSHGLLVPVNWHQVIDERNYEMDQVIASELRARGGLKWAGYDHDVLPAWIAEMDFGLAPEVADALHAAVDRADTGYHYPGLEREAATALVEAADQVCPYSHATRGNIDVAITVV